MNAKPIKFEILFCLEAVKVCIACVWHLNHWHLIGTIFSLLVETLIQFYKLTASKLNKKDFLRKFSMASRLPLFGFELKISNNKTSNKTTTVCRVSDFCPLGHCPFRQLKLKIRNLKSLGNCNNLK